MAHHKLAQPSLTDGARNIACRRTETLSLAFYAESINGLVALDASHLSGDRKMRCNSVGLECIQVVPARAIDRDETAVFVVTLLAVYVLIINRHSTIEA